MGFSNIFGLFGLISIPIIILLYMLRPKNKPLLIPSLYLWQSLREELESASKIKKLKSSILMFLQIGVVLLLTGILAGLFIQDRTATEHVMIVVECGYTMQSTDTEGSRMELAKTYVETYLQGLSEGTSMSLVALEEVPRVLISDETDKSLVLKAVNSLESIDGIGDLDLATEALLLVKKPNTDIVYFGDRMIKGALNYQTMSDTKNYSVHEITYTKYPEQGTLSALIQIYNHDRTSAVIPVSLYVDDVFFAAKQLTVEQNSSAKLFFEDIPVTAHTLKVHIDEEDQLSIDNTAVATVSDERVKKALLVTTSNIFLEKILRLYPNLELTIATAEQENMNRSYSGYDVYIFDRVYPKQLPVDGALFLIDPVDREEVPSEGYVEYPKFTTSGNAITKHIEKPEFSVRVASVFANSDVSSIIYKTEFGTTAYTTDINGAKTVVFGFNLQDTDLPLSVEFPVLMMNCMDYLLTTSLVDMNNTYTGSQIAITILPNVTKAYVTSPDGMRTEINTSKKVYIFNQTSQVGTYTIEEETADKSLYDAFTLNVPRQGDADAVIDTKDQSGELSFARSLEFILGALAVLLICMEWMVYSYRRKIHGNSF